MKTFKSILKNQEQKMLRLMAKLEILKYSQKNETYKSLTEIFTGILIARSNVLHNFGLETLDAGTLDPINFRLKKENTKRTKKNY